MGVAMLERRQDEIGIPIRWVDPPAPRAGTPREKWLPIPGWEGFYEVSNRGKVRSVERIVNRPGRGVTHYSGQSLKNTIRKGYSTVMLSRDGKQQRHFVHRLVLEAFVGPRPEGAVTRHLDGHPANNVPSNLAWGTPLENMVDRARHGTDHWSIYRGECVNGHAFTEHNTYFYPSGSPRCRRCRVDDTKRWRENAAPELLRKTCATCGLEVSATALRRHERRMHS